MKEINYKPETGNEKGSIYDKTESREPQNFIHQKQNSPKAFEENKNKRTKIIDNSRQFLNGKTFKENETNDIGEGKMCLKINNVLQNHDQGNGFVIKQFIAKHILYISMAHFIQCKCSYMSKIYPTSELTE